MTDITDIYRDERIVATYASHDSLAQAKSVLKTKLGLPDSSINIIKPDDKASGDKLEGSPQKIGQKMWHIHLLYSLVGLIVGMICAFILVQFGPSLAQQNPMFTYIALISPGIFIGVFVAGLQSLKPQHDRANMQAVESKKEGLWTLVIDTQKSSISREDIVSEVKHTHYENLKA